MALLFLFGFNVLQGFCQEKEFQKCFKDGNAELLAAHFSEQIDLKVSNTKGIYGKQQAKLIMADFFKKTPALVYKVKHNGGSKAKAKFEIGELSNSKRKFRTYLLYQVHENSLQIIELRIEPED